MVLDYNEDRSLAPRVRNNEMSDSPSTMTMNFDPAGLFKHEKAKIHIDILSNYEGFGGGSYKMTAVKRMTATSDFLDMPYENSSRL